jgi:hypothetical protein
MDHVRHILGTNVRLSIQFVNIFSLIAIEQKPRFWGGNGGFGGAVHFFEKWGDWKRD